MAGKSYKRQMSDGESEGNAGSKKLKADRRRSDRTTKGTGGAAEQLRRVGKAVSLAHQKEKVDNLANEARNPLAPDTPGRRRTKKASLTFSSHHFAFHNVLTTSHSA